MCSRGCSGPLWCCTDVRLRAPMPSTCGYWVKADRERAGAGPCRLIRRREKVADGSLDLRVPPLAERV
jgi:hypothetical protein